MAKAKFSAAHTHLGIKRTLLVIAAVLVLIAITVFAALQTQSSQEHAALPVFTTFAVKGNIFVDTNKNGIQDNGEVNYTGQVMPTVEATFLDQEACGTFGVVSGNSGGGSSTVVYQPSSEGFMTRIADKFGFIKHAPVNSFQMGGGQTLGNNGPVNGFCRGTASKVITCTVNGDGTYSCISNAIRFNIAKVVIVPPSGYSVTSQNPVVVNSSAATVNFGIATGNAISHPSFVMGH